MPAERRGLSSRTTQEVTRDREIDDESTNSRNGSEVAGGVACQSEGRLEVPLLYAVRQGASRGCAVEGVAALPEQRWRARCRRPDVCGHRSVWREQVA